MKKLLKCLFTKPFWYTYLGINAVIFVIFAIAFAIVPEYSIIDEIYTITTLIQVAVALLIFIFMVYCMIMQKIKKEW